MTKIFGRRILAALALVAVLALSASAQDKSKKTYTLHGKIEAVKQSEKKATVKHDKIEGYMGAMTMDYGIGDPAMVNKLKTGDEITATIYDGDYTLYDIKVAPPAKK